jgi:hypothetical protein
VGGDGKFSAWIDDAARPLVSASLDTQIAAISQALDEVAEPEPRQSLQVRLAAVRNLRRQLSATQGRAYLTGHEHLVTLVIRDAASQAAYALHSLAEEIAISHAPLSESVIGDLRGRTAALTSGVDAVIACESHRRPG